MAKHVVDARSDRGAVLGTGIAACAEPIAQELVSRLRRRVERIDNLYCRLKSRTRSHASVLALLLAAARIVRALSRHQHSVDMAFTHPGVGDADELGLLVEFSDV